MPTITLKNIPDDLYRRIKDSAARNQRSINRHILYTLDRSLEHADPPRAPAFPPITDDDLAHWRERE